MDCPSGQKKMAVVEKWSLVEVRLYCWGKPLNISHRKKILNRRSQEKRMGDKNARYGTREIW